MEIKNKIFSLLFLVVALMVSSVAMAQNFSAQTRLEVAQTLTRIVSREVLGGAVKVDRMKAAGDKLEIYASIGLSYYPFREDNVRAMYDSVRLVLPEKYANYRISIITDRHSIEEFIPDYYRTKPKQTTRFTNTSDKVLVEPLSSISKPTQGLAGRHIAMWQSHGRYYYADGDFWKWQRPPLYCTTEDLLTQSFVVPFLMPMLENAGALVYTPRERDWQTHCVIGDNDMC